MTTKTYSIAFGRDAVGGIPLTEKVEKKDLKKKHLAYQVFTAFL